MQYLVVTGPPVRMAVAMAGDRLLMKKVLSISIFFFCISCKNHDQLTKEKAEELVRLNYLQQNTTAGEGTWMLKEIVIDSIKEVRKDTALFHVFVHTTGFYKPAPVDSSEQYGETFYDTLQFTAAKANKVWMADEWTILGSRHE